MKMKSNPFVEMEFGFVPGNSPEFDMLYVVYLGHEQKPKGRMCERFGGFQYVRDTIEADKKACPVKVVCVFTEEADAQKKVTELNSNLNKNDVHFKYQGQMMMTGMYAGLSIENVSTVGVVTMRDDEYSCIDIKPVCWNLAEEKITEQFENEYGSENYDLSFVELYGDANAEHCTVSKN